MTGRRPAATRPRSTGRARPYMSPRRPLTPRRPGRTRRPTRCTPDPRARELRPHSDSLLRDRVPRSGAPRGRAGPPGGPRPAGAPGSPCRSRPRPALRPGPAHPPPHPRRRPCVDPSRSRCPAGSRPASRRGRRTRPPGRRAPPAPGRKPAGRLHRVKGARGDARFTWISPRSSAVQMDPGSSARRRVREKRPRQASSRRHASRRNLVSRGCAPAPHGWRAGPRCPGWVRLYSFGHAPCIRTAPAPLVPSADKGGDMSPSDWTGPERRVDASSPVRAKLFGASSRFLSSITTSSPRSSRVPRTRSWSGSASMDGSSAGPSRRRSRRASSIRRTSSP